MITGCSNPWSEDESNGPSGESNLSACPGWLARSLAKGFAPKGVRRLHHGGWRGRSTSRPSRGTTDVAPPDSVADLVWFLAHPSPGSWTVETDALPAPE